MCVWIELENKDKQTHQQSDRIGDLDAMVVLARLDGRRGVFNRWQPARVARGSWIFLLMEMVHEDRAVPDTGCLVSEERAGKGLSGRGHASRRGCWMSVDLNKIDEDVLAIKESGCGKSSG